MSIWIVQDYFGQQLEWVWMIEFYPILSQISTMNHDDDIFLHCNQKLVNNESISVIPNCLVPCDVKLSGAKMFGAKLS